MKDFNPLPGIYRICYAVSARAHKGQMYGHLPYFKAHVLPLAEYFKKRGMWEEACLALLHDTVEDHPDKVTYDKLDARGVPDNLRDALRHITKNPGEDYKDYLERVMGNDLAWRVKIQDVLMNLNGPVQSRRRILKYAETLRVLVSYVPPRLMAP